MRTEGSSFNKLKPGLSQLGNLSIWSVKMSWKQLVKPKRAPFHLSHNCLASCAHKRLVKSDILLLAMFIGAVY